MKPFLHLLRLLPLLICFSTNVSGVKPIRLSTPEVLLTGWNARCLTHADLNKDGLEDLIYFNMDKSYLEILYRCAPGEIPPKIRPIKKNRWEPHLEDASYIQERIFVSGSISGITTGDLNSDGNTDLVTGSPENGLNIYFREYNSTWSDPFKVESEKIRSSSLSLKVITTEDEALLYAFTEPGLERITFSNGQPIYPSDLFREDDRKAYGVELLDLNGDGSLDWLYLIQDEEYSLKVRLGRKDSFGPELAMNLNLDSFPSLLPKNKGDLKPRFCSIDSLSREAIIFNFSNKPNEQNAKPFSVVTYDLFSKSNKKSSWVIGDFNGDTSQDLVSVSSSKGELLFLESNSSEFSGAVEVFPSLKGISELSVHQHQGKPALLLLSREEEVLGLSPFINDKGFLFPKLLKLDGRPIVACSSVKDDEENGTIIVICEKESKYFLQTLQISSRGKYELVHEIQIKDVKREPSSLFPCFINDDDELDLMILSNRESPVIFFGAKENEWRKSAVDSVVRKSFLKGITSSRLTKFNNTEKSQESMLVAGDGFVRVIRWEDGDFNVLEQYNAKDQSSMLSCPVIIDWEKDGNAEVFAFHEDGHWERLTSGSSPSNQINRWEGSFLEPSMIKVFKAKNAEQLLSFGSSGFQVVTTGVASTLSLNVTSRYLTDLPTIRHNGIESGDFNNDGLPDLVCLDGKKNLLEFLTFDQDDKIWKSEMHFEVFEKNLHYRGKKGGLFEPREGLVLDLNGDQLDDIVFLVHNRLLLYKQMADPLP